MFVDISVGVHVDATSVKMVNVKLVIKNIAECNTLMDVLRNILDN